MNQARVGNFTSSEIVNLFSEPTAAAKKEGKIFGAGAMTYISECNNERRLGRSISNESAAHPLTWGKACERRVFDLLGTSYAEVSQESLVHPKIDYWTGSPDGTIESDAGLTVVEVKSPFTLGSFCTLVNPIYFGLEGLEAMKAIREGFTDKTGMVHPKHKEGDTYYWQIISNAILTGAKFAEFVVFCPLFSTLNEIRSIAQDMPPEVLGAYYWLANSGNDDIPWLVDGGFYQSLNKIRFEVPEEDKQLLTERVKLAGQLLIPPTVV